MPTMCMGVNPLHVHQYSNTHLYVERIMLQTAPLKPFNVYVVMKCIHCIQMYIRVHTTNTMLVCKVYCYRTV